MGGSGAHGWRRRRGIRGEGTAGGSTGGVECARGLVAGARARRAAAGGRRSRCRTQTTTTPEDLPLAPPPQPTIRRHHR